MSTGLNAQAFRGTVLGMTRVVLFCLLFLVGCTDLKIGRDYASPSPSWIGQPVAEFMARNPNAKSVYEDASLHVFEKMIGYKRCDIGLELDGEVISGVMSTCPSGMLWAAPPSRYALPR